MSATEPRFTDQMRARARQTWDAALGHRFFHEVVSDTLEDRVFARYLRIEYGFVDTAASAMGYAVGKAPGFRERRHLGLNLHALVTDQEQYFVDAFERIGAPSDQRTGLPKHGLAAPLHDLFLETAKLEAYEEILACMLGAEWMYLTWCSQAHLTPSHRPELRDWVALHAGGRFAEGVEWIRAEIDARGPALSATRQARLHVLFERALAAEIVFHSAAYD